MPTGIYDNITVNITRIIPYSKTDIVMMVITQLAVIFIPYALIVFVYFKLKEQGKTDTKTFKVVSKLLWFWWILILCLFMVNSLIDMSGL